MKRICDVHYEYPCEVGPLARAFIDRILKKNPEERIGIDEVLKHPFLSHSP
jgi:serine/threonine protein kinase